MDHCPGVCQEAEYAEEANLNPGDLQLALPEQAREGQGLERGREGDKAQADPVESKADSESADS